MGRVGIVLGFAALIVACGPRADGLLRSAQSTPKDTTLTETAPEVAVTVDDLPTHGPPTPGFDRVAIAERLLSAFNRHGIREVYGFVNGKRVADDPSLEAILRRWREAGHPLGNHTYSHVNLNQMSLADYFADLEHGEEILKKLESDAGLWKIFRYPFLYEGDTNEKRDGVREYLSARGYIKAEVSIDADDWAFNAPFSRCTEQNDVASLTQLHQLFVDEHVEELRRMRELGHRLVHREVRQILLLHIGAADADAIEDLLTAYEREGVKWIDLQRALADEYYQLDTGAPARFGAAFPYRVAKARAVQVGAPVFARDLEDVLERTCPVR
jgi:peptidoglycan/xylan/chitin deacetylase (PgdA/CDA1 family)